MPEQTKKVVVLFNVTLRGGVELEIPIDADDDEIADLALEEYENGEARMFEDSADIEVISVNKGEY